MADPPNIYFAGGGSGGHIYPNLAVWERLAEDAGAFSPCFLVSDRAVDAKVMQPTGLEYHALPARPIAMKPAGLLAFMKGYRSARRAMRALIRERGGGVMLCTGGFVSAPAAAAARAEGLPVALVSLDAVPGKANKLCARTATEVFTAYDTDALPSARRIGTPLRRAALATESAESAREQLGLDADRPTLLIFAGSQGGRSINHAMMSLLQQQLFRDALTDWQIAHLTGPENADAVCDAYRSADLPAWVEPFDARMGLLWAAASLVICRAGAGSVAEAWANAVPAICLPYPHHRDQHQRLNARPMVEAGGAIVLDDRIDPQLNTDAWRAPLIGLLTDPGRLETMHDALRDTTPPDGAEVLATWVRGALRADG